MPLLKAMDTVKPTGHSKLKELLGNIFKMLSYSITSTSAMRQKRIKTQLLPSFKVLCKPTPSAALLFCDKLEEELRKLNEPKITLTNQLFLRRKTGTNNVRANNNTVYPHDRKQPYTFKQQRRGRGRPFYRNRTQARRPYQPERQSRNNKCKLFKCEQYKREF
ncbi:hypothetical protein DPMN_141557 [Dreissena polymorpha]|uniref:Uncharacterized protein n=1 Tax=Dreissena polymorpha TaxID=45954 RepID=A0A9D4GFK7_DREPO|nr:hypothetical protein DPMN_141557 [Dreissena polymorpha]